MKAGAAAADAVRQAAAGAAAGVGEGTGQVVSALKEGQKAAGDAVDKLAGGCISPLCRLHCERGCEGAGGGTWTEVLR